MKHLLILIAIVGGTFFTVLAQANDKLFFHNGKTVEGKVIKVDEFFINYKYVGEDAEQTISKMAVQKIVYGSGREEEISQKIEINSKEDWEKVEILIDKSQIVGLKKLDEIQGKTMGFFSGYTSSAGADKRSMKKLLEAAAEMRAPFVYITADKDATAGNKAAYGTQGNKKGIAYTY